MKPEVLFTIVNCIALLGWLGLAVKSYWRRSDYFVIGIIVALLSVIYSYLLFTGLQLSDFGKFSSLAGIKELFQNETALLAGWVHYLAFDLMVGYFIVSNARKHGIKHWAAMLCAIGAFFAGPVGLLAYLLLRTAKTKRYFLEN